MVFYDSAYIDLTILSVAEGYTDKKQHHKYLYMVVLMILLLNLRFCLMNYDSIFRSYNSVFHEKNVLFMQHKSRLFVEGCSAIMHKLQNSIVTHPCICNSPSCEIYGGLNGRDTVKKI